MLSVYLFPSIFAELFFRVFLQTSFLSFSEFKQINFCNRVQEHRGSDKKSLVNNQLLVAKILIMC